MKILVTGAAGFIGANLVMQLLRREKSVEILGIDSLNDYYDPAIKDFRLAEIEKTAAEHPDSRWTFVKGNIADKALIDRLFGEFKPDVVVNLAAQAGVRYSITNPDAYVESNLIGFYNILEACRHSYDNGQEGVKHLVYASSSSVYGSNKKVPYSTDDKVDNPVSLYAATKKSNELMAHAYSKLYNIPSTGLRFFTVYGPWGRPDMALQLFAHAIMKDEPIKVFNGGRMRRDFTYIDDIVEGVVRLLPLAPKPDPQWDAATPDPATSSAPWRIYNIGNNQTVELNDFIAALEDALGKKAIRDLLPMQPGDVEATWANIDALSQATGFAPVTPLKTGIERFVAWFKEYYYA